MFKADVLNNFPVYFLEPTSRTRDKNKAMYIDKRLINNNAIEMFKQKSYKSSWNDVINNKNQNDTFNEFLRRFILL